MRKFLNISNSLISLELKAGSVSVPRRMTFTAGDDENFGEIEVLKTNRKLAEISMGPKRHLETPKLSNPVEVKIPKEEPRVAPKEPPKVSPKDTPREPEKFSYFKNKKGK